MQWVARVTHKRALLGSKTPSKVPVVSSSKKLYPHCLVLVGSGNGNERLLNDLEWSIC